MSSEQKISLPLVIGCVVCGNPIPFYYNEDTGELTKHPWHYTFFSQFKWYQKLIGGTWYQLDGMTWIRIKQKQFYGKE